MKDSKKTLKIDLVSWILTIVVSGLAYPLWSYIILPRIGWSASLMWTIALALLSGAAISCVVNYFRDNYSYNSNISYRPAGVAGIMVIVLLAAMLVSWVVSWRCFHVDEIKDRLDMTVVSQEELVEMLPPVEQDGAYSWADSATAHKLAARKTGELNQFVNIYVISDELNTTVTDGKLAKYVPLKYAGILKAGKVENIPGYVSVNPVQQKADYVEHVIRYSPDAYFQYDLHRHARKAMPNEYFGRYTFQKSPEGAPVWVMELERACGSWVVREVYGVAIINAETGAIEKYELADAPEWVSCISGETAQEIYNGYGHFINGAFNLSGAGQTVTTDDFGYVAINGEMYYTFGITADSNSGSSSNENSEIDTAVDESNLGLMLYNAHSNKAYFCEIPGAEEYSAMEEVEGIVQNFGYKAAFPSLTNVGGHMTYVMVLKSDNGVVKQYGMVNYENYTIAVTADTLDACRVAYAKALANAGAKDVETLTMKTLIVDAIEYIVQGGETTVYIRDMAGNVYKAAFEEGFLFVKTNDSIEVGILDETSDIKVVTLSKLVPIESEQTESETENIE